MNAPTPFDKPVTIHEAKTHLSKLVAQAEAGREIVIARGSVPVAKLVPLEPLKFDRETLGPRIPGRLAHLVPPGVDVLGEDFWEPLSNEEMGLGGDDPLDQ